MFCFSACRRYESYPCVPHAPRYHSRKALKACPMRWTNCLPCSMASMPDTCLVAATAAHSATASRRQAGAACGRFRGAVLSRRAENRKLQGVPPARAFRAGDLRSFGKHDLLIMGAAIVTQIFVYGHLRYPAPLLSLYCRNRVGHGASAVDFPAHKSYSPQTSGAAAS